MQQRLTISTWIISLCAHNFLWYESNWFRRLEGLERICSEIIRKIATLNLNSNSKSESTLDQNESVELDTCDQALESHVQKLQLIQNWLDIQQGVHSYYRSKCYDPKVNDFIDSLRSNNPVYHGPKNKQSLSANPKLEHFPTCSDQYFQSVKSKTEATNRVCALEHKEPYTSEIQFQRLSVLVT